MACGTNCSCLAHPLCTFLWITVLTSAPYFGQAVKNRFILLNNSKLYLKVKVKVFHKLHCILRNPPAALHTFVPQPCSLRMPHAITAQTRSKQAYLPPSMRYMHTFQYFTSFIYDLYMLSTLWITMCITPENSLLHRLRGCA